MTKEQGGTVKWQRLEDIDSYEDSTSFCDQHVHKKKKLGEGEQGTVKKTSLGQLRDDFGEIVYQKVKRAIPFSSNQTLLAIKYLPFSTNDFEDPRPGIRAQYLAGNLTMGKDRSCTGIVPIYAAWICKRKRYTEEIAVMPIVGESIEKFARGQWYATSEEKCTLSDLISNFLRLYTALIQIHSIGITHNDIQEGNVVVERVSMHGSQLVYRYRQLSSVVMIPPSRFHFSLTDFGICKTWTGLHPQRIEAEQADLESLSSVFYLWFASGATILPEDDEKRLVQLLADFGLPARRIYKRDIRKMGISFDMAPLPNQRLAEILLQRRTHPLLADFIDGKVSSDTKWVIVDLAAQSDKARVRSRSKSPERRLVSSKPTGDHYNRQYHQPAPCCVVL